MIHNPNKMLRVFTGFVLGSLFFVLAGCNKGPTTPDQPKVQEKVKDLSEMSPEEIKAETEQAKKEYYDAQGKAAKELYDKISAEEDDSEVKEAGKASQGSCNAIAESSTCIEYVGSFWGPQSAKLNCSDSGIYSSKPCPSGSLGGCNTGVGTQADMITWMYTEGAGEIDADGIKYAKMACEATVGAKWLNGR